MKWQELLQRGWELVLALGERLVSWLATSGLRIVLVLLFAWIATKVLKRLTSQLRNVLAAGDESSERAKRADTLAGVVRTLGGILVLGGTIIMVLREVGVEIGPLIATAGIGGLAIGFGAQTLVKDVITGFFLLLEDQVRVGDVVTLADKSGLVEGLGLRTIRVRDASGTVHIVPNSSVTIVSNMTRDYSRYVVDIPVGERSDPKQVFGIIEQIGEELSHDPAVSKDILEPLEILGLESPTRMPVVKARITTRPRRQWHVGRELNLRIKERFSEAQIELR